jgi:cytochrome P450
MIARLDHIREAQPVCPVRVPSGDTVWMVSRYEDVRFVHTDPRFSRELLAALPSPRTLAAGDWADYPETMVNLEGTSHRRRRQPVYDHLNPGKVERLVRSTRELVDRLLDRMEAGERPTDFVTAFAARLPGLAMGSILGLPVDDYDRFLREWWPVGFPDLFTPEENFRAHGILDAYADAQIARRRGAPTDDLLGALVSAGGMTDTEIRMTVKELMFGALANYKSALSSGLLVLLSHREHFAALGRDPDLAPLYFEELVRLHPDPIFGLLRAATEDLELHGVRIARGEGVLTALIPANRDPSVFARPDEFDPYRDEAPNLSFGRGPHHCIGAPIARMQIPLALAAIARRFPTARLACPPEEIRWHNGFHDFTIEELPITW